MYQISFQLGLCPRPHWGAHSAPPDSLAGFKGPYFSGKGGKGMGRKFFRNINPCEGHDPFRDWQAAVDVPYCLD